MPGILLKFFQKLIWINNIFSKHNQNINNNQAVSYFDSEFPRRRIVLVVNAKITRRDTLAAIIVLAASCLSGELSSRRIVRGELSGGELSSGE